MTNEQREILAKIAELNFLLEGQAKEEFSPVLQEVLSLIKKYSAELLQKNAEIAEKDAEIEKKDKQIDLMANSILAREIGKNSCQFNETCIKFEKGRDTHCKDCIKQYFTNKVNSKIQ